MALINQEMAEIAVAGGGVEGRGGQGPAAATGTGLVGLVNLLDRSSISQHGTGPGRGLHSSTFRLNLCAFCGIGGASRGCSGGG